MDEKIKKWLLDILGCIDRVNIFIGSPKEFKSYENNILLQQAVERNLEIIGEAMSKILKELPDIPISSKRRIVDTRNKIIHGYDDIEAENIWNIIINHLPTLEKEIRGLLNQ